MLLFKNSQSVLPRSVVVGKAVLIHVVEQLCICLLVNVIELLLGVQLFLLSALLYYNAQPKNGHAFQNSTSWFR